MSSIVCAAVGTALAASVASAYDAGLGGSGRGKIGVDWYDPGQQGGRGKIGVDWYDPAQQPGGRKIGIDWYDPDQQIGRRKIGIDWAVIRGFILPLARKVR
jgi:opacity protein-like surface antigen